MTAGPQKNYILYFFMSYQKNNAPPPLTKKMLLQAWISIDDTARVKYENSFTKIRFPVTKDSFSLNTHKSLEIFALFHVTMAP